MGVPSCLAAVERDLLTRFPRRSADLARTTEFKASFGGSVVEAADTLVVAIGTLPPTDLAAFAERLANIVTGAVETAAAQLGVSGSPWILEAQRWAVEAFFARVREVSGAMTEGKRA